MEKLTLEPDKSTITLSSCQTKARESFGKWLESDGQFYVLTGGPGRGKSFMTELLMEDVTSHLGAIKIHRTATTNKAARVVADFSEHETGTIHSLLGLRVSNDFKTGAVKLVRGRNSKMIRDAFILVDEISMVDKPMLQAWEEGTYNCRFLLVGDKDQLATVGENNPPVFHLGHPQSELKTVMRQAEESYINALASQFKQTINTGIFLPIHVDGVDIIKVNGPEFQDLVDSKFTQGVTPDKFKIVCWKNDTVQGYNNYIRGRHYVEDHFVVIETVVTNKPIMGEQMLYSTDEYADIVDVTEGVMKGIKGYWYRLAKGCQVFQATDPEEVKQHIKRLASKAKAGDGWQPYFQAKEDFADLRAIHACTAFKAQGSSYDAVFIDLSDIGQCRNWQQVARMLYVAITRAKYKVYLYGDLPIKYTNFHYGVTPLKVNSDSYDTNHQKSSGNNQWS